MLIRFVAGGFFLIGGVLLFFDRAMYAPFLPDTIKYTEQEEL
jgi:hypothetical protein